MTSDVAELLRRLIRIDSVNPDLVPGGAGEATIAAFAAHWLTAHGFEVRLLEPVPGRTSVLAVARGTGSGASVMLNGHLDTVSLASYDGDGLDPILADGNLYGRGAYDMKSGLAAMMTAAAEVAAEPHRGDIVLALVADEEWASAGTEEVLRHVKTDTAIVVEPSGLDLVVAHRGFVWADVTVHGRGAHGSRPDLGVDAIAKTGPFLTALDRHAERLTRGAGDPLLGTGSIHASLINGGTEASTYPDRCTVTVERRTISGEDADTVATELRALLDLLGAADPAFRYDLTVTTHCPPFDSNPQGTASRAVSRAYTQVTGHAPVIRGEAFWTDCALLAAAGIDTVLFGVDGGGAHAASEWVTLDSLQTVERTLVQTIATLAAGPAGPGVTGSAPDSAARTATSESDCGRRGETHGPPRTLITHRWEPGRP